MGPEILSSTGAGVWRKAPMAYRDSSSVLDKFQSAKHMQKASSENSQEAVLSITTRARQLICMRTDCQWTMETWLVIWWLLCEETILQVTSSLLILQFHDPVGAYQINPLERCLLPWLQRCSLLQGGLASLSQQSNTAIINSSGTRLWWWFVVTVIRPSSRRCTEDPAGKIF